LKNVPLIVIQCRINSKRLPFKALYPIAGIPLIVFLFKRLKNTLDSRDYRLVLATTKKQEDDILAYWAQEEKIDVIRGQEDNVVSRYNDCLDIFDSDIVVRVTGDNPLTCPNIIKFIIDEMIRLSVDYIQPIDIPYGVGAEVYSSQLIRSLNTKKLNKEEKEHLNLNIINNPDIYLPVFCKINENISRPDIRLTVDTKEDWECINALFTEKEKEQSPWKLSLLEIIKRVDKNAI